MSVITTGVFRIGADAELRYVPSGEAVINLSLAFNYGKKNSENKRPTTWIDAGLWGDRAASLAQHLTKGRSIFAVLEDLHIETYNKRDGTQGSKLVARIGRIDFISGLGDRQEGAAPGPAPAQAPAPRPATKPAGGSGFDDMDDDIPF